MQAIAILKRKTKGLYHVLRPVQAHLNIGACSKNLVWRSGGSPLCYSRIL